MDEEKIIYSADNIAGIRDTYSRLGAVVVRNAVESKLIDDMRETLIALIRARLEAANHSLCANDLDEAYLELKGVDGRFARELIIASRETMAFYRILTSPKLERIVSELLPGRSPQIVHDCCMMRIDGRNDDRNFEWHYDYAYNAMSENAVTCWIPVTRVSQPMGNMRIVPGSHSTVRPIKLVKDLATVAFAGPRKIELDSPDTGSFDKNSIELPVVNSGDAVFLHALTLHRSGVNTSDHARWIVNPRFSDLMDPRVTSRGWKVSRAKDPFVFAEIRPDRVTH